MPTYQPGDALPLITGRRSVRRFTDQPLTDDDIHRLLTAAMAAPSAMDRRPWEFVVARDPAIRARLAGVHRYAGMCADAPAVFAICGREADSAHWSVDCSAATENLLLEAASLGLGGVWIGIYPTPAHEQYVREVLGIPADVRVLCLAPVGHPAERPEPRVRFVAARVHHDRY